MLSIFLIFAIPHVLLTNAKHDDSTLEFVFAVFRHGFRTNDRVTTYPKDPYRNVTYYPYGWEQLTNKGKMREYNLGQKLHERYSKFVGMYTPEVVEAVSTGINRTKMSLELVLAGLFPPTHELIWNKHLLWQPIPYNYLDLQANLIGSIPANCPNRLKLLNQFLNTSEGDLLNNRYRAWYNYVSSNTGLHVNGALDLSLLYFGLRVEEELGFKLPAWVTPVYPEILRAATIDLYHLWSATSELAKLGQGFLLKTMLDVSAKKIDGSLNPVGRKIMLFSAHDIQVSGILLTMKAFDDQVPPYGGCVIVELHKINNVHGFKIYYEKHTGEPPVEIIIPECEHFCPLTRVQELLRDRIPESYDLCG